MPELVGERALGMENHGLELSADQPLVGHGLAGEGRDEVGHLCLSVGELSEHTVVGRGQAAVGEEFLGGEEERAGGRKDEGENAGRGGHPRGRRQVDHVECGLKQGCGDRGNQRRLDDGCDCAFGGVVVGAVATEPHDLLADAIVLIRQGAQVDVVKGRGRLGPQLVVPPDEAVVGAQVEESGEVLIGRGGDRGDAGGHETGVLAAGNRLVRADSGQAQVLLTAQ